jgi:hypothetical protein
MGNINIADISTLSNDLIRIVHDGTPNRKNTDAEEINLFTEEAQDEGD